MATLPSWDPHYEEMVANEGAVAVSQSGNTVSITGKLEDLIAFESAGGAGTHKWVGIDIGTNLPSIVGATWNGSALTQADEDEAASVNLGKGHIVFWAAAENLPRTITIGSEDKDDLVLTFNFVEA